MRFSRNRWQQHCFCVLLRNMWFLTCTDCTDYTNWDLMTQPLRCSVTTWSERPQGEGGGVWKSGYRWTWGKGWRNTTILWMSFMDGPLITSSEWQIEVTGGPSGCLRWLPVVCWWIINRSKSAWVESQLMQLSWKRFAYRNRARHVAEPRNNRLR